MATMKIYYEDFLIYKKAACSIFTPQTAFLNLFLTYIRTGHKPVTGFLDFL